MWALQRATCHIIDHPEDAEENGDYLFSRWSGAAVSSLKEKRSSQARRTLERWQMSTREERKRMLVDGRTYAEFCEYVQFAASRFREIIKGTLPIGEVAPGRRGPKRAVLSARPHPVRESARAHR
jgi:hypothetical protein